jgi:hypothetical protein
MPPCSWPGKGIDRPVPSGHPLVPQQVKRQQVRATPHSLGELFSCVQRARRGARNRLRDLELFGLLQYSIYFVTKIR